MDRLALLLSFMLIISSNTLVLTMSEESAKRKLKVVALPANFSPSRLDVLCGRDVGPESYQYPGNQHFRKLVQQSLEPYTQAKTKFDKGLIVMSLVDTIRNGSPNGGFIRFDRKSQSWFEIGDEAARK